MSRVKLKVNVSGKRLKEEKRYWIERLARIAEVPRLRPDVDEAATYSSRREGVEVTIPESLRERLTGLVGDSPFLLYTVLMAALKVCLYRYTDSQTSIVGSPARQQADAAEPVTNALAILDHIDGMASFRNFLLQVRQTLVEAYARQNYPFDRLVKALDRTEANDECAWFDVTLRLRELHWPMPDLHPRMAMTFSIADQHLSGEIEYDASQFRRETVERFARHFTTLLDGALTNLDAAIDDLELLTEQERYQLVVGWNQTQTAYPRHACIHELFAAVAEASPQRVALVCGAQEVSYGELNRQANQLGNYLRRVGVGPESLVGLMVSRGVEMVVGLLGVLKAGAAYVPLDPSYPKERLAFMMRNARISVLLTEAQFLDLLPGSTGAALCLDKDWALISREDDANPQQTARPESLAYVIYTSGSTGQPKGVMIEHKGIGNLAEAQIKAFDVRPESRVLQFAAYAFDASVSEIFVTLTAGATLVLGPPGEIMAGHALAELLRDQRITVLTLPPAVLATLDPEQLPDLKTVVTAGEACPAHIAEQWSKGRRFINAYGPTEATVCATLLDCTGIKAGAPPIGRPISNTRVYILDSRLRPVPVGVPGELHIGGIGLATGYWDNPELTEAKFIRDPFTQEPGARLYKSGDLARYLPDGNIEYLGRIDSQVKIRGFRVEPQEVEHVLRSHPSVRDSAVIAYGSAPGDKQLIAYIVGEPQGPPTADGLRVFLKDRLPDYMMPATFIMLDRLPLTPNGKADRRALPAPSFEGARRREAYVAPSGPVEEMLAAIWSELLKVGDVGVHDNFFELGGHSLLATQITTRVRSAFAVEIPLSRMFEAPTIAALAQLIDQNRMDEQTGSDPPIEALPRGSHSLEKWLSEMDQLSDEELRRLLASEMENEPEDHIRQ